jgi:hypothetical protein
VRPKMADSHAHGIEGHAKEAIAERSHHSVEGVRVREEDAAIVISGTAPSFYAAQLALAAVQNLMRERSDSRALRSAITVHP